jgi:hypothetical protein
MNFNELCQRARDMASNGADWNKFLFQDDVGDAYGQLFKSGELDKNKLESAFIEGYRSFCLANNWVVCWTDARADYDQFDTDELECHEWHGKVLRKVLMHPENAVGQRGRYLSGAFVWDEDPRITEALVRAKIDRENSERDEKMRVREEGLFWLREIVDLDLEAANEDVFDVQLRKRELHWMDVRREQTRRSEEAATAERLAQWEKCRSAFVDGCTIVDPGRDGRQTKFGPIAGSDCAIYRNVRVVPHWEQKDDVDEARVEDETGGYAGSLRWVADRITSGDYRIATVDEHLPPHPVMDRLKPSRLYNLLRVETEGRIVWACRLRYSYEIVVLDEAGKLARKKSIKEAAEAAVRQKDGGC